MTQEYKDFLIKSIKNNLEQYIYWQIEATENIMNGFVRSIMANNFMSEKMFEMALDVERLGLEKEDVDWKQLYMEASEKARKRYFEENQKD